MYECTAKNVHGQESAKGTIAVLGKFHVTIIIIRTEKYRLQLLHSYLCDVLKLIIRFPGDVLEQSPGDRFVNLAFKEANLEIDRAVNATIDSLFGSNDKVINPEKLMRMSRFPDVVARDVAKSADIFERTLANVRKHVQAGLKINLTESNYFSFEFKIVRRIE